MVTDVFRPSFNVCSELDPEAEDLSHLGDVFACVDEVVHKPKVLRHRPRRAFLRQRLRVRDEMLGAFQIRRYGLLGEDMLACC